MFFELIIIVSIKSRRTIFEWKQIEKSMPFYNSTSSEYFIHEKSVFVLQDKPNESYLNLDSFVQYSLTFDMQ